MPFLDVSEIVSDPDFADDFWLKRRSQAIDPTTGRAYEVVQVFKDLVGTVTMENPADLMRRDDSDSQPRLIFIAAEFEFRGISKEGEQQYKGDIVVWPPEGEAGSTEYTVLKSYPYPRYGSGFYEAVCESMNAVDEAIPNG